MAEWDFHEIMEAPMTEMSDAQIRALLQVCQEERTIPTARAAKVRRKSEELSGKTSKKKVVQLNMEDLF
jgi:hypothetical protein